MVSAGERSEIGLVPLTQEQFDHWTPSTIADYALQHTLSGRWGADDAQRLAREEFDHLLPQGMATPDHVFYSIARRADASHVGMIWIAPRALAKPTIYIYNIEIFEAYRRRGYAQQAMLLLEDEARRLGAVSIRLHVFAHNAAARSLYVKLGYRETNLQMAKEITPEPGARQRPPPPRGLARVHRED